MKKILLNIVVLMQLSVFNGSILAKETLVLNTGIRNPFTTDEHTGFVDKTVHEIFQRIDVNAKVIVYQNANKSLNNANQGIDDGVSLRIEGLEQKFPNLVRIPEKLMDNDFVAYSLNQRHEIRNWQDLNELKLAYVNGWQIFQNNLPDHHQTVKTQDALQLMDLLSEGQVDTILYERWQGLWHAQQLGLSLQTSEPPLAQKEMFIYLHKKHNALIEPAAKALRAMKADGTYKAIFDQTLGQLEH